MDFYFYSDMRSIRQSPRLLSDLASYQVKFEVRHSQRRISRSVLIGLQSTTSATLLPAERKLAETADLWYQSQLRRNDIFSMFRLEVNPVACDKVYVDTNGGSIR